MKKIKYKEPIYKDFLTACEIVENIVGVTYSPKGRNVILGRQYGLGIIVHDGVTVFKEIEVEDEYVSLIVDQIRESATKQVTEAGDGTTLTSLLSCALIRQGVEIIKTGKNPMILRRQIDKVLPSLLEEIKKYTQEVKTHDQIYNVAQVSSDDAQLAKAVAEAVEKVGQDGLILPEEHNKSTIEVSFSNGLELNKGWGNFWQFVTNPDRMESVIEDASVLILGRKVTFVPEIQPLLEAVVNTGSKNIVIIGDVSGEALAMVLGNKIKGNINAVVIAPPSYGDIRRDVLDDLALVTGATVVVDEIGMKPQEFATHFDKKWIGTTKMVISKKNTTNVVKYEPSDFKDEASKKVIKERNKAIADRIGLLKRQQEEAQSPYDREKIQERIARLTTGIATIKIGGKSDTWVREKMERAKDAIPATQAAIAAGIVPGGGVVLLQIAKIFEGKERNDGEEILYQALLSPLKRLLINAGESEKSQLKIMEEIKKKGGNYGYDCEQGKVVDLSKAGIVDPAKVIRMAIEHSVVVATSILTSDALIAVKRPPEKEKEADMRLV